MMAVMVVDDQAIIREPIAAALRRAGYETLVAADGAEAIAKVTERMADLILLDLAMPVMDGLTTLRSIRSLPEGENVPVIILTAIADRAKAHEAAQLKVKGFMLKSRFSLTELLELVELHCGSTTKPAAAAAPSLRSPDQAI